MSTKLRSLQAESGLDSKSFAAAFKSAESTYKARTGDNIYGQVNGNYPAEFLALLEDAIKATKK